MTEQEIRLANRIKDEILPKLQEMQRDLYMDDHIIMSIDLGSYKKSVNVTFYVKPEEEMPLTSDFLCVKMFSFRTFLTFEECQMSDNFKELRGCQYFIKNWQERLS